MESEQRKTALIVGAIVGIFFLGCAGLSLLAFAGFALQQQKEAVPIDALVSVDAGVRGDEGDTDVEREVFAKELLGRLNDGGAGDYVYDAEAFELRADGGTMSMANLFDEYQVTPDEERAEYLERLVRSMHPAPLPEHWAEAKKHVLVSVRDRLFVELFAARGQARDAMVFKEIAPELVATLVFDTEDGMQFISDDQLKKWSIGFDEAFEQGLKNLTARSSERFEELEPGIHRSPWRDNYDTGRMLLSAKLQRLKVKGKPVVFLPNRDTLLVTGSEDEDALYAVVDSVDDALGAPRAMTGRAWVLDGKSWKPFLPPPASSAYPDLRSLALEADARDYNEQKSALDARHDAEGVDLFVATSLAADDPQAGRVSYCVWTKGAESLLPKTDFIVLVDLDKPEKEQLVAAASWDAVQKAAGALLSKTEPGLHPVRYRVNGFPNPRVIRALGIHPVFARSADEDEQPDDSAEP